MNMNVKIKILHAWLRDSLLYPYRHISYKSCEHRCPDPILEIHQNLDCTVVLAGHQLCFARVNDCETMIQPELESSSTTEKPCSCKYRVSSGFNTASFLECSPFPTISRIGNEVFSGTMCSLHQYNALPRKRP